MKKLFNFLDSIMVIVVPIILFIGIMCSFIFINYSFGVKGFGPERDLDIKVTRLYVDYSGDKESQSSHYMVGTDQGVFEVSNFWFPFTLFNSDELYSKLEVGKTYKVTVKGNKVLNFWFQQYPYIIKIH
jgi:hypothetical protein